MDTEYEATFPNINKGEIRLKLTKAGAKLVKPEYLMTRLVFDLLPSKRIPGAWLRVRQEGDKTTMSLKIIKGNKITDQQEICLEVDNFKRAVDFLETIGCPRKAYQESRRELWKLNQTEITIDEWPYLEPFVEIEGSSEKQVKRVSKILDFNYQQALFCSVDTLYHQKYGIPTNIINFQTPIIAFDQENPFINKKG